MTKSVLKFPHRAVWKLKMLSSASDFALIQNLKNCQFYKIQPNKKLSILKMQYFYVLDLPTLISRKISMIENNLNFHTLENIIDVYLAKRVHHQLVDHFTKILIIGDRWWSKIKKKNCAIPYFAHSRNWKVMIQKLIN